MKHSIRFVIACFCVMTMMSGVISCSQKQTTQLELPAFYDEETITKAHELIDKGYELLDGGDLESAVAKFAEVGKLVPGALAQEYHTTCAYARNGEEEEAFQWLERLVNNGYDSSEGLDSDPDLESLRENPRYEELVNRAKSNYEAGSAAFAHGLPEYTEAPDTLDTEEKLNEWVNQQNYILYMHRPFWSSTQHLSAQIDRTARYLTALKKLKKDDPDFDYGLERVRTSFRMKTIFESGWGVVADLILHEVKAYKQSSPSAEGLGEANYYAAVALSLKFAGSENRRVEGFKEADTYLAEIDSGTKYYGASKALKLINKYQSPDADKKELGPRIRSVIEEFPNDEEIYNAVSSRLNHEAVSLLWPIPLDLPDLDGNLVSLGEYRGKVLLMDFWATWCSPCRAELPNLIKTYKEYQPKGLEVLSISLDYPNRLTTEAYRAWIKENEMNWRHVYDGKGWDSALVKRYFIGSIPAPFLVGPDGSLVAWGENCRGEKLAANVEKALELMTD